MVLRVCSGIAVASVQHYFALLLGEETFFGNSAMKKKNHWELINDLADSLQFL